MAQFYRIHLAGYRKSCRARLRPHIRDRQTDVIQHHRLMPPPSGRRMTIYCKMHGERRNMIEMSDESNSNVGYDFVYTKMSREAVWKSRWMVQMWREVVKWYKNKNAPPFCPRHFGTSRKKVRHFSTKDIVPNCLGSEVSWVRSVRTPLNPPRAFVYFRWS